MQTQKVVDHIVHWLKDYAEKANVKGFVIGISGGIDSAVTSTLCAKTGLKVKCLEMPIHQAENQVSRALRHIDWLKENFDDVELQQVNLTPVFDSLLASLPKVENEEERFMSLANTRARLRMTSLYYFAALESLLVAGTGNKVEDFGVGFYTKYGDGGVDLSPIADLLKTEVYEIAEHLGIHEEILTAAPTDGLWGDDRTDEDQIGATYPELEWAMHMDDLGKTADNFEGRKLEVFKIYKKLNTANQHKMQPIPVCEIPLNLK
ncbi:MULTISPECIES: NAD(+) synthase [Mesonia]|uniref:NH(3)-dependent NAD(+) synthetase n=2 Tax=Mesonia mobilis TaxID=369791 RepID=A0ABQ3BQ55_9FLAO|nr:MULTISPECIES: NAD(+) synthase [Mesonia]GGZ54142.1 NH(3)-dependent NAD(+) synthetase [Mesonia mobilis]HIB37635.1 NAD(+) synthase [Mesonia sp.]HIO28117.1 NAD(+) synthase [Flavobacteriaceae bacterium]